MTVNETMNVPAPLAGAVTVNELAVQVVVPQLITPPLIVAAVVEPAILVTVMPTSVGGATLSVGTIAAVTTLKPMLNGIVAKLIVAATMTLMLLIDGTVYSAASAPVTVTVNVCVPVTLHAVMVNADVAHVLLAVAHTVDALLTAAPAQPPLLTSTVKPFVAAALSSMSMAPLRIPVPMTNGAPMNETLRAATTVTAVIVGTLYSAASAPVTVTANVCVPVTLQAVMVNAAVAHVLLPIIQTTDAALALTAAPMQPPVVTATVNPFIVAVLSVMSIEATLVTAVPIFNGTPVNVMVRAGFTVIDTGDGTPYKPMSLPLTTVLMV